MNGNGAALGVVADAMHVIYARANRGQVTTVQAQFHFAT
jgi:hypothetical protein